MVQVPGNLLTVAVGDLKFGDARREAVEILKLVIACNRPKHFVLAGETSCPVDSHIDNFRVVVDLHNNAIDQVAKDDLSIGWRRLRRVPQRCDVVRQRGDQTSIRVRELRRLFLLEPFVLFVEVTVLKHRRFPFAFQFARDKAVFWLRGMVLSGRSLHFITCPLATLGPMLLQSLPLTFNVARCCHAELQRCRLQYLQPLGKETRGRDAGMAASPGEVELQDKPTLQDNDVSTHLAPTLLAAERVTSATHLGCIESLSQDTQP